MRRGTGMFVMLLAIGFADLAAQEKASDFAITPAYRSAIITAVAARLDSGYFNAERAAFIKRQLAKRAVLAAYDSCRTAGQLTAVLTRDLQSWSRDRHLRVVYSVEPRPLAKSSPQSAEQMAARLESARSRNFGFHAVERLTGNVGYLEIGRFEAAASAAPTLSAAMQFLANTDALIIDLRSNGGGHADMVALVTSHFLAEQTRLATLERRNKDASDQIWSAAYVAAPRYLERPVYVLTSSRTFSGAEGLTYDLKHFAHATVVGERTRGGANPGSFEQIDEHFAVFVPTARVVHAATGTNWDDNGIAPDIAVPSSQAKRVALRHALERLVAENPAAERAGMWKQALDEIEPSNK